MKPKPYRSPYGSGAPKVSPLRARKVREARKQLHQAVPELRRRKRRKRI